MDPKIGVIVLQRLRAKNHIPFLDPPKGANITLGRELGRFHHMEASSMWAALLQILSVFVLDAFIGGSHFNRGSWSQAWQLGNLYVLSRY